MKKVVRMTTKDLYDALRTGTDCDVFLATKHGFLSFSFSTRDTSRFTYKFTEKEQLNEILRIANPNGRGCIEFNQPFDKRFNNSALYFYLQNFPCEMIRNNSRTVYEIKDGDCTWSFHVYDLSEPVELF